MRIQLISRNNGYGLTTDARILRSILEPQGHEVEFTDWKTPRNVGTRFYHINFFLELVNPVFFGQAQRNYLFANPEWTMEAWMNAIRRMDAVLCKTHDCERIFQELGVRTIYTGFTSEDRLAEVTVDQAGDVLHLVGNSIAKGTGQVVETAKKLPDVRFTVIGKAAPKEVPPNVTVIRNAMDSDVRVHQNVHAVHLQPSTYEGFGHCLNEARSVRALIVTTAADPMMELATPEFAFGAQACNTNRQHLAVHKQPCVDGEGGLVDMVRSALEVVQNGRADILGDRARAAFINDDALFKTRLNNLITT